MKTSHILVIAVIVAASAGQAVAANDARDPYENSTSTWTRNMQAQAAATHRASGESLAADGIAKSAIRTIAVDGRSWVTIDHLEVVRLVDTRGQSFVWQAGGPRSFPLKMIAPPRFDSGEVWVAVNHPRNHVTR